MPALRKVTALGEQRASTSDPEFAIRQLVEVAARALSPGINDPYTAISVLDRLGAVLCDIATLRLPTGAWEREGRIVLLVPKTDYQGLTDAMFHLIRQNAASSPAVLIRMLEVIAAAQTVEPDKSRREILMRHADLVLEDGEQSIKNSYDRTAIRDRHAEVVEILRRSEYGSRNLIGTGSRIVV